MQSQNLYHPPTVTSPPTHSGSGGYVGAVIRSLHFSSSGGISRGLVGSLNSHPCLAVTRSPTLPRCQRKPSGEIGLLLPSNSNKAVSPFSCWSGVTGSLLKGKSRCLRLWGLNKKKNKQTLLIPKIRKSSTSMRKDNQEMPAQRWIRYDDYLTRILN